MTRLCSCPPQLLSCSRTLPTRSRGTRLATWGARKWGGGDRGHFGSCSYCRAEQMFFFFFFQTLAYASGYQALIKFNRHVSDAMSRHWQCQLLMLCYYSIGGLIPTAFQVFCIRLVVLEKGQEDEVVQK
ncbi:hypothetical protein HDK77DRAFT_258742 [Phyllosticta capitalensis]